MPRARAIVNPHSAFSCAQHHWEGVQDVNAPQKQHRPHQMVEAV
jgi:hypothetical protein